MAAGEKIDPLEVFYRDGWKCFICHGDIDPNLRKPDPLCATLEHEPPLSRGGQHIYSQVFAAHLKCNISKGSMLLEEYLAAVSNPRNNLDLLSVEN